MPRSRIEDTGETVVEPTVSVAVGSRFWRRLVVHHSSSVFPGLSWSRFDCIQSATLLTQANVDERFLPRFNAFNAVVTLNHKYS